jgi:hypothetical protein
VRTMIDMAMHSSDGWCGRVQISSSCRRETLIPLRVAAIGRMLRAGWKGLDIAITRLSCHLHGCMRTPSMQQTRPRIYI